MKRIVAMHHSQFNEKPAQGIEIVALFSPPGPDM